MLNSLINLIWKFRRDEFEKSPKTSTNTLSFLGYLIITLFN